MSLIASRHVWANNKQDGSKLLLLLAIADFADDNGVAWPSIESLAAKTRIGARQVKRLVDQLEQDGEIAVQRGVGRNQTSIYTINLAAEKVTSSALKGDIQRGKGDIVVSPFDEQEKVTSSAEKVTSSAEKVTSSALKGDIAMSPERSERPIELKDNNNNNDSSSSSSSSSAPPAPEVSAPQQPEPQTPELSAPAVAAIAPADWARVRALYEENFGLLTSLLLVRIQDALRQHPADMVVMAMDRAVSANKRRWDYVEGILRNWSEEGYGGSGAKSAAVGTAAEGRGAGRSGGAAGATSARRQEAPAPEGLREWLIATGQVPVVQAAD